MTPTPTTTNTPVCTLGTFNSFTEASESSSQCGVDDTFATAESIYSAGQSITANEEIDGYLSTGTTCVYGDQDFYEFIIAANMTSAHIYIDCYSAPQTMIATLYNSAPTPTPVATVSTAGTNPVAYTFTAGVTYFLEVSNGTGPYKIKITSP